MNKSRSQVYLARSVSIQEHVHPNGSTMDDNFSVSQASHLSPEEAAEYIAEILVSLRAIAIKAHLDILSDLIEVAQEEAQMHTRR